MKGISFLIMLFIFSCASETRNATKVLNDSLRQCYVESDSYTGKDGEVQGKMKVSLEISPLKKVTQCKIIENDFKDANLNACVCDIFKRSELEGETGLVQREINFQPVKQ